MPPPPRPILPGSTWWRASAYEVVGGTHIAPAEGSKIEKYDPLLDAGTRPYSELLDVVNDPEGLCRWAERFGLLGILLHQTVAAFFWPRWEHLESGSIERSVIQQVQYRAGQGADVEPAVFEGAGLAVRGEPGTPVTLDELQVALQAHGFWMEIGPPGVRSIAPVSGSFQETDLTEGYAQFFPRVPGVCEYTAQLWRDRYRWVGKPPTGPEVDAQGIGDELSRLAYPVPPSDAFFRAYGEPISLMRIYIHLLNDVVQFWGQASTVRSLRDLSSIVSQHWEVPGWWFPPPFTSAMGGVQPTAVPSETKRGGVRWKLGWDSRSLFGSLNTMVLQDFAFQGMRMLQCPSCKRRFVTKQYNKKYCSSKCQHAAETARLRERRQADRARWKRVRNKMEEST